MYRFFLAVKLPWVPFWDFGILGGSSKSNRWDRCFKWPTSEHHHAQENHPSISMGISMGISINLVRFLEGNFGS